jgi:hypothetical protein
MDPVVYDVLDLTDPHIVVGKHSIWVPKLAIKVPFQWAGQIQKYQHPDEGAYPVDSLMDEIGMLKALAEKRWAPRIGKIVYFKTVISRHKSYWWADPFGAYGYEMENVNLMMTPGDCTFQKLKAWADETGLITGSERAWNDLAVPERKNIWSGWLIDVRRSWFDRLHWHGEVEPLPRFREDLDALTAKLATEGQFPFKERMYPYQDYYLNGQWKGGERRISDRADLMQFNVQPNDTVLDVGTCTGGFLQYAALQGAGRMIGLDVQPEYIDLARDLARVNGMNICLRLGNLEEEFDTLVPWISSVMGESRIDHLLLMSMLKHFKGGERFLWNLIDGLWAKQTYLESNAVKPNQYPLKTEVESRGGALMGTSQDRNDRRVYKIVRS